MKYTKTKIFSAVVLVASLIGVNNLPVMAHDHFSPIVDEKGNISFPTLHGPSWIMVCTRRWSEWVS
ncbi:MAG: hypothetical protein ACI88H_003429 [Cocleimonas sp.]|jgi:hypothetical protein